MRPCRLEYHYLKSKGLSTRPAAKWIGKAVASVAPTATCVVTEFAIVPISTIALSKEFTSLLATALVILSSEPSKASIVVVVVIVASKR